MHLSLLVSFSVTKSGGMFIKIRVLIKVFLELGLELWSPD